MSVSQKSSQEYLRDSGFVIEPVGSHSSRTIMLKEVERLFSISSPDATYPELRRLVVDDNVLQKSSLAGRMETFRRLREFYALDFTVPLYKALRFFWSNSEPERPLLAALCALARDPIFRVSASIVLRAPYGSDVTKAMMETYLADAYPNRYSKEVLAGMTRRILSSWTQSGHLKGRSRKIRQRASCGPASTAYALALGYLEGARGNGLFQTLWVQVLDAPLSQIHEFAFQASRRQWIDYRHSADIIDVDFGGIPGIKTEG